MGFLEWLEETSIAEWARVSIEGYPIIITAHSIGLAVMVGIAVMLDLRLLGRFREIPFTTFNRILVAAWLGFAINFLSGLVLLTMQATDYVSNTLFLIKVGLVLLGAVITAQQHFMISRNSVSWSTTDAPSSAKVVAIMSLVFWIGAIIVGRQIAYQN
ncbi:MAG: hypothetical protein AB8B86_17545 [Pseudomonadales bacterium]